MPKLNPALEGADMPRRVLTALADLMEGKMMFIDFCIMAQRAGVDIEVWNNDEAGGGSIVYHLGSIKARGVDVAVTLSPSGRTGT